MVPRRGGVAYARFGVPATHETASLEGRRALVTGGSSGIGAQVAWQFAAAGVDVGIVGRDAERLGETQEAVEGEGRDCLVVAEDLATVEGIERAAEAALAHSERWDILVNSAGIAQLGPLLEITASDWDAIQAVNLRAAVFLAKAIVPQMIERGGGKVVNISSLGAFLGTPGFGMYAASKGGMNAVTRTMAVEWGPHNIQVNAVCPTVIMTPMGHQFWDRPEMATARREKEKRIPMHRFGEPHEVADLVLYLASPASDYINGVAIPVDGGLLASP